MSNKFSSGKNSIAICDRCGWQFLLKELRGETWAQVPINNRVCDTCWDLDHPQLMLGRWPVEDPQAVRNPRPDTTYAESREIDLFVNNGVFCVLQLGTVTVASS